MITRKLKKKKYANLLLKFWFNFKTTAKYVRSKKKKWRFLKFQKSNFKLNTIKRNFLIKSLKHLYKERLLTKKRIKYLYGNLSEKRFKILFKKHKFQIINLLKYLECKIDVLLYRAQVINSIYEAKTLLKKQQLKLNNKKIKNLNIFLIPGDILSFSKKVTKINTLKYIEVNYKTSQLILLKKPLFTEIPFLFQLNLYLSSEFYKK